ncbi:hypothetical protein [Acinetobacter gandensis]|uniref:hypothetical protein n=1 Tax=Acinetobacter gandensis TaxID=1443941 RepID=UPI00398A106A
MLKLFFLYLGLFTTPFYFFNSGSVQPSHIFFMAFSLIILCSYKKYSLDRKSISIFLPFYLYVVFINSVFILIHQDFDFIKYSAALTLNGVVFLAIINFLRYDKLRDLVVKQIPNIILFIFIFLISCWVLGFGEYKFGSRYNGFFNDPNQMAFFVLCCSAIACLFSKNIIYYIAIIITGFFLISLTVSRSGLIGEFFIVLSLFFCFWKGSIKSLIYFMLFNFLLIFLLILNIDYMVNSEIIQPYINRASNTEFDEQADIRGYTRILNYSEYLIFGAGQGLDERFNANREIHSTWAGILFYYGIIGLSFFCYIIFKIFIRLNITQKLLFIAPLMYGFSTFGARTIIFWVFMALFYYTAFYLNKRRSDLV